MAEWYANDANDTRIETDRVVIDIGGRSGTERYANGIKLDPN
jgi:hypothetical protein